MISVFLNNIKKATKIEKFTFIQTSLMTAWCIYYILYTIYIKDLANFIVLVIALDFFIIFMFKFILIRCIWLFIDFDNKPKVIKKNKKLIKFFGNPIHTKVNYVFYKPFAIAYFTFVLATVIIFIVGIIVENEELKSDTLGNVPVMIGTLIVSLLAFKYKQHNDKGYKKRYDEIEEVYIYEE